MNSQVVLFFVLVLCFFYSCKDSTTDPQTTNNSIEGTWEYSGDVGFVDIIDPINPYFPKFIFKTDNSFDESARFVLLPSKEYIGYKYVKTGSYNITSDTITLNIKNEIYVSFEDSLQEKPIPLPVNSYSKNYKFIIVADTLKMALLGVTGLNFINYIKQ
jgi:hypothetical protein